MPSIPDPNFYFRHARAGGHPGPNELTVPETLDPRLRGGDGEI
jgi:hypothetical protein